MVKDGGGISADVRAQTFTFEAAMALMIIALVILFIISAIPLTPLTSSAANVQVENILESYASDILNVMCYKSDVESFSPMKSALLYWDGEPMYGGVYDYPYSAPLKNFLQQTLEKEGIAYNIEIGYFTVINGTKTFRTATFVWNGYPSDNSVTVSKIIPLYDSDPANQGIKTLTFDIDGNATNLYNIIEVRLTLWRM